MKRSLGAKTLLYPMPLLIIGSYDREGKANVMAAAWGGIACSKPPCVSVSLRAATATHGNILARKAFTISLPESRQVAQADFFGMVSGRKVDKFAATGLTAARAEFVDAPYVAEFRLILECALLQVHELGLHTQFIGEIKDVKVDDGCLDAAGNLDARKLDPVVCALSAGGYFALGAPIGQPFAVGGVFREQNSPSSEA